MRLKLSGLQIAYIASALNFISKGQMSSMTCAKDPAVTVIALETTFNFYLQY